LLLANLGQTQTNRWKVNTNRNLIKCSCRRFCLFNAYYSSE